LQKSIYPGFNKHKIAAAISKNKEQCQQQVTATEAGAAGGAAARLGFENFRKILFPVQAQVAQKS